MLARERWQTFENSWGKNTIFNEHPVPIKTIQLSSYFSLHGISELGSLATGVTGQEKLMSEDVKE